MSEAAKKAYERKQEGLHRKSKPPKLSAGVLTVRMNVWQMVVDVNWTAAIHAQDAANILEADLSQQQDIVEYDILPPDGRVTRVTIILRPGTLPQVGMNAITAAATHAEQQINQAQLANGNPIQQAAGVLQILPINNSFVPYELLNAYPPEATKKANGQLLPVN